MNASKVSFHTDSYILPLRNELFSLYYKKLLYKNADRLKVRYLINFKEVPHNRLWSYACHFELMFCNLIFSGFLILITVTFFVHLFHLHVTFFLLVLWIFFHTFKLLTMNLAMQQLLKKHYIFSKWTFSRIWRLVMLFKNWFSNKSIFVTWRDWFLITFLLSCLDLKDFNVTRKCCDCCANRV